MSKSKETVEKKFDEATVRDLFGSFRLKELQEFIGIVSDVLSKKIARRQRRKTRKR